MILNYNVIHLSIISYQVMPVVIQRINAELTIKNGEILTLLSKEQENSGYWLAYSEDGRVGHIPSNYVEVSLGLYIDAVIMIEELCVRVAVTLISRKY